ncbi:MAG: DUF1273 family protein [Clostridia bacterium]|nr:DUF1273 family protein [Clostridia bacterium]
MEDSKNLKCCFTGYRPNKFPFSVYDTENALYRQFENSVIEEILKLCHNGCRTFYTGMAMGFDIIAAEIVLLIKNSYNTPIELVCVVPFKNQGDSFSPFWKNKYTKIIENSDSVICLNEEYHKGCYQQRNKYMVENSDYILTWYDGKSGGTRNTIDYAAKIGRYIINANREETEIFAIQTTFEII